MNNKYNGPNQLDMFFTDEPTVDLQATDASESERRRMEKIQAGTLDPLTGKRKRSASFDSDAPAKQGEARGAIPESRRRQPLPDQYGLDLPTLLDAYDHFSSRVFNTEKLRKDIATVREASSGLQYIDPKSNLYHQLVIIERRLQDATDGVYGWLSEKAMTPVQVGQHMIDRMSVGNGYGAFARAGTIALMPLHWFTKPVDEVPWSRITGQDAGDLLDKKGERTICFRDLSIDIQNLLMSKLCCSMDPEVPITVRSTESGLELKLLADCAHSATFGTLLKPYRTEDGQWSRGYVIAKITEDRHLTECPDSPIYATEECARYAARQLYWTGLMVRDGMVNPECDTQHSADGTKDAVSAALAAHRAIDQAKVAKPQIKRNL